jgi:mRNA interferase MazF
MSLWVRGIRPEGNKVYSKAGPSVGAGHAFAPRTNADPSIVLSGTDAYYSLESRFIPVIPFHPQRGQILLCSFHGLTAPEMVKRRAVVVVSPRFRGRSGLCTIVPLSTTPPSIIQPYHCRVHLTPELPPPFHGAVTWLKGDMIYTLSFDRFDCPRTKDHRTGKRIYHKIVVDSSQLAVIERCITAGLGLSLP